MNPKNYREWSADVNLVSDDFSRAIAEWPDVGDYAVRPVSEVFCTLFNGASICLIAKDFTRNHHRSRMPKFAVLKPRFWRQKDEN